LCAWQRVSLAFAHENDPVVNYIHTNGFNDVPVIVPVEFNPRLDDFTR
jgi:hypothetical protein